MRLTKSIWVIAAVIALFVLFGAWNVLSSEEGNDQTTQSSVVDGVPAGSFRTNEDKTVFEHQGVAGEIALETLRNLTDVETQVSDFGEFVVAIGGVESDSGVNFWAFYVNGQQSEVGAGSYRAEEGDQIEWRIEEIIF